ncbi:retrotransposable element Tf2 [Tanacetum coccineum]
MTTPAQLKWLPKLMGFDYEILFKKRVKNVTVDALSRLQNPAELLSIMCTSNVSTDLYPQIVASWEQDLSLKILITKLQSNSNVQGHYTWANQQLRRKGKLMVGKDEQLRGNIIKQLHRGSDGGHSGVQLNMSTSYHPRSDGQTEVVNRSLECYLRCMTREQPKQWYKWLSLAEWWYNTNFHTSIKTTPFEAVYGKAPPVHIPYIRGESKVEMVDKTMREREAAVELLKFHMKRAQDRMKSQADKHRTDKEFDYGDWVYLRPFKIVQKIGQVAYKLELPDYSQLHNVVHVSQLKRCRHPSPNQQMRSLPPCDNTGLFIVEPIAVLDRRLARRGNEAEVYVLVQWANGSEDEATWEPTSELQEKFLFSPPKGSLLISEVTLELDTRGVE